GQSLPLPATKRQACTLEPLAQIEREQLDYVHEPPRYPPGSSAYLPHPSTYFLHRSNGKNLWCGGRKHPDKGGPGGVPSGSPEGGSGYGFSHVVRSETRLRQRHGV